MDTVVSIGATPLPAPLLDTIAYGERPIAVWYPTSALAIASRALMAWQEGCPRMETMHWSRASGLFYGLHATDYTKCYCCHLKTAKTR